MAEVSKCGSCGAFIVWARSVKSGVSMPIDADPVLTGGNIELDESGSRVQFRVVTEEEKTDGRFDLHVSHFATCPDGETWRNRR
jgi:hypothetical protein